MNIKLDYSDVSFKNDGRLKLLIIVGTRPEIIRLAAVINKCRKYFDCVLAHTLLSPRHHVAKEYRFSSAEPMAKGVEESFRDGVVLADGYECKSAIIDLDEDRLGGVITLTEGKYHQIKRMVASTSNRVTYLERISFAGIPLDRTLARGEWRYLTDSEVEILRKMANPDEG